ncbi:putative 4-hydroxybenzoate polyprenyltransferase [Pendulispora rubella]|uniref:4-hydroxybenzoate polyprenyltransferase n=1 Tax=Pendulispora rubella TaxID=2741070 RepID=A0ABZ2KZD1_9BACT
MIVARLRSYSTLVAFAHTIFALPFAASAVVLALSMPHPPLTAARVVAMLICMVSARTSAMAFNRWADRDIDAKNPRTATRPIQRGDVRPWEAAALALASAAVFVLSATTLGTAPAVLALPVLAVLLGYSYAKRFTWAAHAWLGVALSLAPGGAWIAVGAPVTGGILALMVAVVTWLLGFDVLYSLQDEGFDREQRLHSIPSRFGASRSLAMSAFAHVVTVSSLALTGVFLHRGVVYFAGILVVAGLLVWEHLLIHPPVDPARDAPGTSRWARADLSKIDKAFFDMNAWISVGFFAATLIDHITRTAPLAT